MKRIVLLSATVLATALLGACAPYPPGDCRYDSTCKNYPHNQNSFRDRDSDRADYYDDNYQRGPDGYYYRDRSYRGSYYNYDRAERRPVPGGMQRPDQPENHPDQY